MKRLVITVLAWLALAQIVNAAELKPNEFRVNPGMVKVTIHDYRINPAGPLWKPTTIEVDGRKLKTLEAMPQKFSSELSQSSGWRIRKLGKLKAKDLILPSGILKIRVSMDKARIEVFDYTDKVLLGKIVIVKPCKMLIWHNDDIRRRHGNP